MILSLNNITDKSLYLIIVISFIHYYCYIVISLFSYYCYLVLLLFRYCSYLLYLLFCYFGLLFLFIFVISLFYCCGILCFLYSVFLVFRFSLIFLLWYIGISL